MTRAALSQVGAALGGYYARLHGRELRSVLDAIFTHYAASDPRFSDADYEPWLAERGELERGAASLRRYYAQRWSRSEEEVEAQVVLHFAAADTELDARALRAFLDEAYRSAELELGDPLELEARLAELLPPPASPSVAPRCSYRNLISNLRFEREQTDLVTRAFEQKVASYRSEASGELALRGVHPKSHGVLDATFEVSGEEGAPHLGAADRVGLFARSGESFPCKLRFSASGGLPFEVLSDRTTRQSHGLAIKVLGEDGESLHDFLFNNAPVFPSKDPTSAVPVAESELAEAALAMVDAVLAEASDPGQPLSMEQFSISAYAWGEDRAVKYGVQPAEADRAYLGAAELEGYERILRERGPDHRREALTYLLEHSERELELRLCVQFADPSDQASGGCPIDDETVAWRTPWHQVARIRIPPQRPAEDGPAEDLVYDSYQISGPEHLPIGRLNRARLHAYRRSAQVRHLHNRVEAAPHPYRPPDSMRVAVVGAGAAGLCSALALSEFGYHVTVYERSASVGGHATTREVLGKRHLRDPAFGVFRRRQWPNFQALLATLGVEPISLGQCQDWFDSPFIGWFHEGGAPLQRDPEVMREGQRFTAALARSLRDPEADGRTVGELIEELSLSQDFVNTWFMGGAILYFGGHPTQRYLDYPLRLVAWMWESSVGQGTSEPLELLRVRDAEYMQAFTSYLASRGVHIRTRTQARLVQRDEDGVRLECAHDDGELTQESFGQLVLAIQPHQALEVLGEQRSEDERRILSGFEHTLDTVVVHEDAAYLPADPEQRKLASIRLPAADAAPATAAATLPYTLSVPCDRDQHTPVLATYDYAHADAWGEEVERFTFSHTVVTPKTQALRRELAQLQGRGSVHYAGSWLRGLTLHEDAVVTGLAAANRILGPNSEFRVLPAPLELPAPFEAMPEADATEGAGFLGGIDSTRAALQEVLRAVLGIDAAELGADADVQALGMSSLQVARLANAINADLPATATEQVDVAMLLQMETLAELVDYVHATAQGEAASAAGRDDAPPEPPPLGPSRREFLEGLEHPEEAPIPMPAVVLIQLAAILALLASLAAGGSLAYWLGRSLHASHGLAGLAAGLPALWLVCCGSYTLVAVAVKWGVLGRLRPGRYRIYRRTHLRWWIANLFLNFGQQTLWLPFKDSQLGPWLLRMLGARVRGRCSLNTDGLNPAFSLVDADLLDLGADSYVRRGALVQAHLFVDGCLVLAPVELGAEAVVWTRGVVEPGASVERAALLEPHSVLSMGSSLPAGTRARGVPARSLGAHAPGGVSAPAGLPPEVLHTLMGALLFPYLLALGACVFQRWLSLFAGEVSIHQLDWRIWLSLWPAFLLSTLSLGALACALKWLLLGRLRPGQNENEVAARLALVKFTSFLASRLGFLCPRDLRWLLVRGMGGRIAYASVTDCPLLELAYADLLVMEPGAFYSPAAHVDFVELRDGQPLLAEVRLESGAYVGACATASAPLRLPPYSALASASAIAPDTELAPSEIWVGAPARRVPLTVGEVSADAHALGGPALLKNRLVDIANHYFIVLLMSLFVLCGLWLLAGSLFPTSAHVDLGARFLASFALLCWLSFGLPLWLLPLLRIDTELLRWLCVEDEEIRSEGFRRDTWKYNVWHLLSNHLLPFALLTDVFAGTPIQSWLARRLGARVGAGAYFANGVGIREFTFTRIGAGAALNRGAGLIAHSELPSGRIVMKDITLGAGSSMGLGSYGVGGTELPAGLLLGSLSRPFDSQQLEAGCEYDNTPCQQRQRSAARPA